ncbi:hypothetical protein, partial [Paracoccus spongiarum]
CSPTPSMKSGATGKRRQTQNNSMLEYDKNLLKNLRFNILYPPEGDSSVLEVSADDVGDFLHVILGADGTLIFSFLSNREVNINTDQISTITDVARQNLSLTDTSWLDKDIDG